MQKRFYFPGLVDNKKSVKRTGFYILQKPGLLYFVRYLPIQEKRKIFIPKEKTCAKFNNVVNTAWVGASRNSQLFGQRPGFYQETSLCEKLHPYIFAAELV